MKTEEEGSRRCFVPTVVAGVLAVAGLLVDSPAAVGQSFTNLGVLDTSHRFSQAVAVSGNGRHVAGNSGVGLFDQMRGFRWSQGSGLTDMGVAPDGDFYFTVGISNDGNTITGGYQSGPVGSAFRWTSGSGFQILADLPGGGGASGAGVSADGQFIAGTSFGSSNRAVRWDSAGTPQNLGVLPGTLNSVASAISGDGTTVVGECDFVPFVWTAAGGMQPLQTVQGATAFAVNFNGSVAAGYEGVNAARWNNGVLQVLPTLSGTDFATAYAVSGNGVLVGGSASDADFNFSAVIWSDTLGAVNLNTYLPTLGVDLTGWNLENCTGISFDGNTLVGQGTFNGESRAWHATIPSPGASAMFGIAGLLTVGRRRR